MKDINFVNTLSPKQHTELKRWAQISTVLFTFTIVGILSMHMKQQATLKQLRTQEKKLRKKNKAYESTITRKHRLAEQEQELKQHIGALENYIEKSNHHAAYLRDINAALTPSMYLESLTINNATLSLQVVCSTTRQAQHYISLLRQSSYFDQIRVKSIHPKHPDLVVALAGRITA